MTRFTRLKFQVAVLSLLLMGNAKNICATWSQTGVLFANNISVTGPVNISTITILSMTVSDNLQILGSSDTLRRGVVQMKCVSSTTTFGTTSLSFAAAPALISSFTLMNINNYIRIAVTGVLAIDDLSTGHAFLTVKRDSTDLGNPDGTGLSALTAESGGGGNASYMPVGVTYIDRPGDSSSHNYQVFIRTSSSTVSASFTNNAVGYLLLEEIGQ